MQWGGNLSPHERSESQWGGYNTPVRGKSSHPPGNSCTAGELCYFFRRIQGEHIHQKEFVKQIASGSLNKKTTREMLNSKLLAKRNGVLPLLPPLTTTEKSQNPGSFLNSLKMNK